MIKNIHTIERRGDLKVTFNRVDNYLLNNRIGSYYFLNIVNSLIKHWEYNKGALNLNDYFRDIGLNFKTDKTSRYLESDSEILLYIQFIFEFFFVIDNHLDNYSISQSEYINWVKPLARMIRERLELSNYTIDTDENDLVNIGKRDPDIDSAILAIDDKQIIKDILSFNDFRNENDLNEKKSIISRFYIYLESDKCSEFKDLRIKISGNAKDIKLFDDFFMIANNFDIRHYPEKISMNNTLHMLDDTRSLELLNLEFRIFLRIINSKKLLQDQNYFQKIKEEFKL